MANARFVHIVDDVPELEGRSDGPVLMVALEGFLDAGNASAQAVGHLIDSGEGGRVVASFDIDEFYDYRARRPAVTFVENRYTDYDAPRLVVRLLNDAQDTPFLLLSGPEPDMRWEGFAGAVRAVIEHFGVRLMVSLGSVPMAVPHTRPVQLTTHATSQRLVLRQNIWEGELRIPSSAQGLLEIRLGEWGHDAMGYVAHIPHYVAQYPYPAASAALIEAVGDTTGLIFDISGLLSAASSTAEELASQVSDNEEIRNVVHGLEQQYDAFHQAGADNLLAEEQPIPTGDELGAQFEQFLAGLDDDGTDR